MLILAWPLLQLNAEELGSDRILEAEQDAVRLSSCPGTDSPSDLKVTEATEENGEQEGEPIRNGAESVSEGEGGDGSVGCPESSSEAPTCPYKPGQSWPGRPRPASCCGCVGCRCRPPEPLGEERLLPERETGYLGLGLLLKRLVMGRTRSGRLAFDRVGGHTGSCLRHAKVCFQLLFLTTLHWPEVFVHASLERTRGLFVGVDCSKEDLVLCPERPWVGFCSLPIFLLCI